MLKRYGEIAPLLGEISERVLVEYDIYQLLLRRAETDRVRALLVDLEKFEAVTKTLQRKSLTLSGTHRLFDHVLVAYPQMASRISFSAPIVAFPELEKGLVKLQRQEMLSAAERNAVAHFHLPEGAESTPEQRAAEKSFVASAFRRRRASRQTNYRDVGFAPPTSNECERFFSEAKLVFTDLRQHMDSETPETVMMLMLNKELWTAETVLNIRSALTGNTSN